MSAGERPVIGICAGVNRARTGPWDQDYDLAPRAYSVAIGAAGGLPLLVPADAHLVERPDELLEKLDALLLAGGADLDPDLAGAAPHPMTVPGPPVRDRVEPVLAERALSRDLPLLGICRGMQMLNVVHGGTLHPHLPDRLGHEGHCSSPGTFDQHEVELHLGSLAATAAGSARLRVRSHHHQGVERLGSNLHASGSSVPDEVIEAIEVRGRRFALGVLWHPEEDPDDRVLPFFVAAAGAAA